MSPRQRTSFFIDEPLAEGLKALKERDGVAEAEAIRRAIAEYLTQRGIVVSGATKTARKRAATRKRA